MSADTIAISYCSRCGNRVFGNGGHRAGCESITPRYLEDIASDPYGCEIDPFHPNHDPMATSEDVNPNEGDK